MNLGSLTTRTVVVRDRVQLFEHLRSFACAAHHKVAVLAGHFMLMYDEAQDALTPMIYQDASSPIVAQFSRAMAGDFPVATFETGTKLVSLLRQEGTTAQIALLVNDHSFLTRPWSVQRLSSLERGPDLRKAFYRAFLELPPSYQRIMRTSGALQSDFILRNDEPSRPRNSILPVECCYFSEKVLRRRFEDHTLNDLKSFPGFRASPSKTPGLCELHYKPPGFGQYYCLSSDEGCDCSGELIEFLLTLAARDFSSAVLYIPLECIPAVIAGVRAFINLPSELCRRLTVVEVVSNVSADGGDDDEADCYQCDQFIKS